MTTTSMTVKEVLQQDSCTRKTVTKPHSVDQIPKQGLLKMFTAPIQGLLKMFTAPMQRLLKMFTAPAQGLLKMLTAPVQGLLKMFTAAVQGLLKKNVHSPSTRMVKKKSQPQYKDC